MTHSREGTRPLCAWGAVIVALAVLRPGAALAQAPADPRTPLAGVLTLRDAVERGLAYNLGTLGLTAAAERARGDQRVARSLLLPDLSAQASLTEQRLNLAAMGVKIEVPNFTLPSVAGPFNVFDVRARVTQTVFDAVARNNYRAAQDVVRASDLAIDDARNQIVLSVASAYLETVAAQTRLQYTRSQVATASALHQKAEQQQAAGLATPLDVSRARVQTLSARQRLLSFEGELARKKIDLARLTGLPPNDQYDLPADLPYSAAPEIAVAQAVAQALTRPDIAAAQAQVTAAERALAAARGERMPSVLLAGDVGASRAMSDPMHATFSLAAVLRVPLWQGGRVEGRVQQAASALAQRRIQLDDLKSQVEADVRRAYVDLRSAEGQVAVARDSEQVMRDTLTYVEQRARQGLAEDVALAQARESVAAAQFEYTTSVFAHNLAKLGLARAIGRAAGDLAQFLRLP